MAYAPAVSLDLFAGARVRHYDAAKSWYERLLGKEPAFFPHATEAVRELAEHRFLFIVEDRDAPGGASITIFVDDLDALEAEIASRGIDPAERVTYTNGVRKTIYRDADRNEIGFGGAPVERLGRQGRDAGPGRAISHDETVKAGQPSHDEPSRRPRSITAIAVALILVGVASALAGIAASAASSCCGSPDPADPTPTLVGIMVAAALSAAGVGLWSGRVSRRVVLLCAAAVPVVALAVSPWSSDFQGLVLVGLLGWLWLWWYLRRSVAIGWVGRHSSDRH